MKKTIGIMGAMPEEVFGITELLSDKKERKIGNRIFYEGTINNIRTIVVFSRWGKVSAATTATTLILEFGITELIFVGVAGAINSKLNIGDIVIGERLVQHDMDASPLIPRFEIPLLDITYFESTNQQRNLAETAIRNFLDKAQFETIIEKEDLDIFGIHKPKFYIGDIASGDKFFSSQEEKQDLLHNLPTILCVEMEGAAVAQVCYEQDIPITVIRIISDTADEKAEIDFPQFIERISSIYSAEIIKQYFELL